MNASNTSPVTHRTQRVFTFVSLLVLTFTLLCVLVPLAPRMPGASLDESWLLGINQALAQGLALGRDLVFTYGPYASIYTRAYHPATDALMLWSSTFLALAFALACAVMARGRPWGWLVVLSLVVAGLLPYPADTLLFSYPLIAALAAARLIDQQAPNRRHALLRLWLLALLLLPFGLLPLIKGTVLILCAAVLFICGGYFLVQRQWPAALLCVVVPLLGACGFWWASGQDIANLPRYLLNMTPIAAGYTEAMALPGKSSAIWNYLVFCALFLFALAGDGVRPRRTRWFLLALFAVFFFIVFKGGFVRQDTRVVGAGASLILATVVLAVSSRTRWIGLLCLVALWSWWDITRHHFKPQDLVAGFFQSTYLQAWTGLRLRVQVPQWPRNDFETSLAAIDSGAGLPRLSGSVDVYSNGQSHVIASGNLWNPRPVLQSYSAYVPELAEMNRQHLLGDAAPDHLFFKMEPLDRRFPSLDDGPSWPVILTRYQPSHLEGDYLLLDRRPATGTWAQLGRDLPQTHALGERVIVPVEDGPVYAELDLRPNFVGSLAHVLFKPAMLEIAVELKGGGRQRFRFIAGMGRSVFMISPLIETTEEFTLLYGPVSHLATKQVEAFSVTALGRGSWMWKDQFQLRFARLNPRLAPTTPVRLQAFDRVLKDTATDAAAAAASCTASIDSVNGRPPGSSKVDAAGALQVRGWAAVSTSPPALADAVLVVLTDEAGQRHFVQARRTLRTDVGLHFKSTTLDGSGYTANLDLSGLKGRYTLGLALRRADRIELCPQPLVKVESGPVSAQLRP